MSITADQVRLLTDEAEAQCTSLVQSMMGRAIDDFEEAVAKQCKLTLTIVLSWDEQKPGTLLLSTGAKSSVERKHVEDSVVFKLNTIEEEQGTLDFGGTKK